jgi:uncharacterized protein YkwD
MPLISNFTQFLNVLSIPQLGSNWIDILILFVILIYLIEGYGLGFIRSTIDFITFIGSFVLGLTFYTFFATILVKQFSIPQGFSNAIGFFVTAFIFEVILTIIFRRFLVLVYSILKFDAQTEIVKKMNKILGTIPGFASAIVLLSFILTMIISLPLSPFLKNSISSSRFGNNFVSNTFGLEKVLNAVFGQAVSDALTFLTVEPHGSESVKLNFKTKDIAVDVKSEKEMLDMVNMERVNKGIGSLVWDLQLSNVARAHCIDMLERGYFSHFTPEGLSPFDRMAQSDISYKFAGENLALAPNVSLAMQGLMGSPGHRVNILNKDFGKVGIGVINGGIYGEMFCQEFTD